jgi:hypothetical protein
MLKDISMLWAEGQGSDTESGEVLSETGNST